jgi:hypothetical protein
VGPFSQEAFSRVPFPARLKAPFPPAPPSPKLNDQSTQPKKTRDHFLATEGRIVDNPNVSPSLV